MGLLEKYRPKKLEEFIGNKKAVEESLSSLGKKPLLFFGAPGVGKTLLCYLIAKKLNLEIYEINASDYRDFESLKKVLLISKHPSIFGRKRLILIDEIDGLSADDKGAIAELIKIFKESKNPIILTANDVYIQKLKNLRNYCKLIQFNKVPYPSIAKYLKKICEHENIEYEESILKNIAQRCNGDVRGAVLDLESLILDNKLLSSNLLSPRDFEENIFNSVRLILKTKKIDIAKKVMDNLDRPPEDFFWWMEENVVKEYDNGDLKKALDFLSLADIFRRRIIKRQDWVLLNYYIDFISIGIALAKKETIHKYVQYGFPTYISKMSIMKSKKKEMEEKIAELQEKMHCSKKIIKEELPYLKQFLEL